MTIKQVRRVFLTWNNWTKDFKSREEVKQYFEALKHFKGAVIGFEVGEQGTEHLQAVIVFKAAKTFKTLHEYFKQNHVEEIRNFSASLDYCKKDNDFIELGIVGGQGARKNLVDFRDAIQSGKSDKFLISEFPQEYFKYAKLIGTVREIDRAEEVKNVIRDVKVIYLAGESRSGKTSFVYDQHGFKNMYRINDYKHPFDAYGFEDVLVLDEFRGQLPLSLMLNLLEGYPLNLPARYENKWAGYNTVYIISNRKIEEQYTDIQIIDPESYNAFVKRIHQVHWMTRKNSDIVKSKIKNLLEKDSE